MQFEPTIGLEVHVQLKTKCKIFCSCSTAFGSTPNTNICPVCLGLPGALPVLNKEAIEKAIMAGIALNCTIANLSKFDRKNYFYPDLPKAYQISQYDKPLCTNGFLEIEVSGKVKRIGITRIHLEEDAGKLIHNEDFYNKNTYVDYNRTGIPLIEIVSEPDIASADEAYAFLTFLKQIMQYLNVSDCNMEEGSLRCDVNISLKEKSSLKRGTKVEIKNLNSFRAVKAAIDFEIQRQASLLEQGKPVVQETRLWNPDTNLTVSMRSKEESHDYRYFPDPDLPPVVISDELKKHIQCQIPELPHARRKRFVIEYNLTLKDAEVLTTTKQLADYFENVIKEGIPPKRASNWIQSELLARLDDSKNIESFSVPPKRLADLLKLLENGTISGKIAKSVFATMVETGKTAETIIAEQNIQLVSDTEQIKNIVKMVIEKYPDTVKDYKSGKEKALEFLFGQIMKETKGQANPRILRQILIEMLQ